MFCSENISAEIVINLDILVASGTRNKNHIRRDQDQPKAYHLTSSRLPTQDNSIYSHSSENSSSEDESIPLANEGTSYSS